MSLSTETHGADVELVRELGAGGMASLWLGRLRAAGGFEKRVAVKVLHAHLARDPTFVEMFAKESRLAAFVEHPNVVQVHQLRAADGRLELVMELVDGVSLSQVLRACAHSGSRVSVDLAVRIACDVAAGLHAAHETRNAEGEWLGIVHRDVSPSNVLLSRSGHVKVCDFGIAAARNQQTLGSSLKGKLRYMSPEQARSERVDRRSDIYSLGVTLWEILALDRLFKARTDAQLLDLVREPSHPPIALRNPEVSDELARVVHRALSPAASERYATARELRAALLAAWPAARAVEEQDIEALVESTLGVPPTATPSTSDADELDGRERLRSVPAPRRSRARLASLAAVIVIAGAGAGVAASGGWTHPRTTVIVAQDDALDATAPRAVGEDDTHGDEARGSASEGLVEERASDAGAAPAEGAMLDAGAPVQAAPTLDAGTSDAGEEDAGRRRSRRGRRRGRVPLVDVDF